MRISRKFRICFRWYSQSISQTIQRSLGLLGGAFWKDRKKVMIATKSRSETENCKELKEEGKLKSIKNENASFSGSNNMDFCLRIHFSDEQNRTNKKTILHKTYMNDVEMKKMFQNGKIDEILWKGSSTSIAAGTRLTVYRRCQILIFVCLKSKLT